MGEATTYWCPNCGSLINFSLRKETEIPKMIQRTNDFFKDLYTNTKELNDS